MGMLCVMTDVIRQEKVRNEFIRGSCGSSGIEHKNCGERVALVRGI